MPAQSNLKKKGSVAATIDSVINPSSQDVANRPGKKNLTSATGRSRKNYGRTGNTPSGNYMGYNRGAANQDGRLNGRNGSANYGKMAVNQGNRLNGLPQGTLAEHHSWESDFKQYPQPANEEQAGEEAQSTEEAQNDEQMEANEFAREEDLERKSKEKEDKEQANDEAKNPFEMLQKILSFIEIFTAISSSAGDIFVSLPTFLIVANGELLLSFLFSKMYKISPLKKKLIILADVILFLILIAFCAIIYQLFFKT